LSNSEYVAAATEMLNTNAQQQITLEELAACVGLSASAIIPILNGN
jgi:transcriptional regulator with XRE-family HTH domain